MMTMEKELMDAPAYTPLELDFKLYLVTDRKKTGGRPLMDAVTDALKGGVKAVQLREKDLKTRDLLRLAYEMRQLTLKYDARLFINDRVDIAIAVDADGVQLTQKSIPPYAVRKLSSRLIIGVSTHNMEAALRAERGGADFVTFGPVYPTPSKAKYGPPVGLDNLREVAHQVRIPVFAIGGITLDNMQECLGAGSHGISVISSILGAKNIRSITGKFIRAIE